MELSLPNGDFLNVFVEYAWKSKSCPWCKEFGHATKKCQMTLHESRSKPKPKKASLVKEWRVATHGKMVRNVGGNLVNKANLTLRRMFLQLLGN